MSDASPPLLDRRGALRILAGGLAAGAATLAGAVGVGFLYPVPKVEVRPRFICLRHQVGNGKTMELLDDAGRKVLLMEKADGELMAIGTTCTHLGCSVFYRAAEGQFECPCHNGWFDAEGTPTAGPPERPLPRFPVTVRDGKVFVKLA
jgi:cytochrome b6-f complex iron-sulfur subunit